MRISDEAGDCRELLRRLEWDGTQARSQVAGWRSTSRASGVVDVLAAALLLSATTLALILFTRAAPARSEVIARYLRQATEAISTSLSYIEATPPDEAWFLV